MPDLPLDLPLDRAVIRLAEIAAPDAALIGNDDNLEARVLEPLQSLGHAGKDLDLFRVAAIIDVPHDRPIAVQKNSRR